MLSLAYCNQIILAQRGKHRITKTLKVQKLFQYVLLKLGKDKKLHLTQLGNNFRIANQRKKMFWHLKWTGQRNDLISFFSEFFKDKKKF